MREVTGFITRDGTFYETKAEAEYEESKAILEGLLVAERIQHEPFIETVEKLHDQIATFVAKYDAFQGVKRQQQEQDLDSEDELGPDQEDTRPGAWREEHSSDDALRNVGTETSSSTDDDFDTSDLPGGEGDAASVLDESVGSGEHVSDMGSGEQSAQVRHNGPKHGSRSRKPDAQRIRRSTPVAAKTQSGTSKAR